MAAAADQDAYRGSALPRKPPPLPGGCEGAGGAGVLAAPLAAAPPGVATQPLWLRVGSSKPPPPAQAAPLLPGGGGR